MSLAAVLLSHEVTLGKQKDPVTAARFGISLDGVQVAALNVTGGGAATDKLAADQTPLKITIDRNDSAEMWAWVTTTVNRGTVEKKLEAQAKGKRRATFTNATITEIKIDDLDANDGKKAMTATITVVPQKLVGASDVPAPKSTAAQKSWNPANFRMKIGGLPVQAKKIEALVIKQKVTDTAKKRVFVAENVVLRLDDANQKLLVDTLAKDKTQALAIELSNDDGSAWKTLTFQEVIVKPGKAGAPVTVKSQKIVIN
jgi:hypothetical protein